MAWTVLLVDDSRTIQEVVRMTLIHTDFNFVGCLTPEEGLKKAEEIKPDIALVDVRMPGMDGYEVCSKLKENPETKDIPVLLLIGQNIEKDQAKSKSSGAFGFFVKPFATQDLIDQATMLCESFSSKTAEPAQEELFEEIPPEEEAEAEDKKDWGELPLDLEQETESIESPEATPQVETRLESFEPNLQTESAPVVATPIIDAKSYNEQAQADHQQVLSNDDLFDDGEDIPSATTASSEEIWEEPESEALISTEDVVKQAAQEKSLDDLDKTEFDPFVVPKTDDFEPEFVDEAESIPEEEEIDADDIVLLEEDEPTPVELSEEESAMLLEEIDDEDDDDFGVAMEEDFDDIEIIKEDPISIDDTKTSVSEQDQLEKLRKTSLADIDKDDAPASTPAGIDPEEAFFQDHELEEIASDVQDDLLVEPFSSDGPKGLTDIAQSELQAKAESEADFEASFGLEPDASVEETDLSEEDIEEITEDELDFVLEEEEEELSDGIEEPVEQTIKTEKTEDTFTPTEPDLAELLDDDVAAIGTTSEEETPGESLAADIEQMSFKDKVDQVADEEPVEVSEKPSDDFVVEMDEKTDTIPEAPDADSILQLFKQAIRQELATFAKPELKVVTPELDSTIRAAVRQEVKVAISELRSGDGEMDKQVMPDNMSQEELLLAVRQAVRNEISSVLPNMVKETLEGISSSTESKSFEGIDASGFEDVISKAMGKELSIALQDFPAPESPPSAERIALEVSTKLEAPIEALKEAILNPPEKDGPSIGEEMHTWINAALEDLPTTSDIRQIVTQTLDQMSMVQGSTGTSETASIPADITQEIRLAIHEEMGKIVGKQTEAIAWEVVPQLAEQIIKKELDRVNQ